MRTRFQKLLSSLLAVVMVLSLIPVSAMAAGAQTKEDSLSEAELLAGRKYPLWVINGQGINLSDPQPDPMVENVIKYYVNPGETVILTPDPAPEGREFNTWFVSPASANIRFTLDEQGRYTFEMPAQELHITANYAAPHAYNTSTTACKTFSLRADGTLSQIYSAVSGQTVYLQADKPYGKIFDHWEADDFRVQFRDSAHGPCFTMPHGHVHITAVFKDDPAMFPVRVEGGRLVNVSQAEDQPSEAPFNPGDAVRVLPNPAPEGQEFKGWTANPAELDVQYVQDAWQFTMPGQAVTLTANYGVPDQRIDAVDLSVKAPVQDRTPENAVTDVPGCTIAETVWDPIHEQFQTGERYTVKVTLSADQGYVFPPEARFTVNGQEAVIEEKTENSVTVSYQFPAAPAVYPITMEGGEAFDAQGQSVTHAVPGEAVSVKANAPQANQKFDHWSADVPEVDFGEAVTAPEAVFVMPAQAVTVTANFHTHTADSSGWHTTPTEHWQTCTCGDSFAREAHTWETTSVEGILRCSVCKYYSIQPVRPVLNSTTLPTASFLSAAAMMNKVVTFPIETTGADGSRISAYVTYDQDATQAIIDAMDKGKPVSITVTLEQISFAEISLFAATPSDITAYRLTLSYTDDQGQVIPIQDLKGGRATVSVPYIPQDGRSVVVNRVEEDGSKAQINCSYDADAGILTWITGRHGDFTISTVDYYGYSKLTGSEAVAYNLISAAAAEKAPLVDLSSCGITAPQISKAVDLVRRDHPEYYAWSGETVAGTTVSMSYYEEYSLEHRQAFLQAAGELQAAAAGMTSDYDKALALHDALLGHVSYQSKNYEDHTAYGAMVNGKAAYDGYAKAYQYLLQQAGIQSFLVTGTAAPKAGGKSVPHTWNLVRLEGRYYYTDPSWNDSMMGTDRSRTIFHAYFNVPEKWLDRHTAQDEYKLLPACNDEGMVYRGITYMDDVSLDGVYKALQPTGEASVAGHFFYTGSGDSSTVSAWLNGSQSALLDKLVAYGTAIGYKVLSCGREAIITISADQILNMPNSKPAYGGSTPFITGVRYDLLQDVMVLSASAAPEGESLEYGMTTTDAAAGVMHWQDSNEFTAPMDSGSFYFFVRVKETEEHRAGTPSASRHYTFNAPLWATILETAQDSVTLKLRNRDAGTLVAAVYDGNDKMIASFSQSADPVQGVVDLTFPDLGDLSQYRVKLFLLDAQGAPLAKSVEQLPQPPAEP